MAITPPKPLDVGELIGSSNEDIYECPSNTRTLITTATAHNTSASTATLTAWLGAAAGNDTRRLKVAIAADDTLDLIGLIGQAMNTAEKIIMVSGTADVISVRITGTEFPVTV